MSLTFPDWYKGGYPDREWVVIDLLRPFLELVATEGETKPKLRTSLPKDYAEILPIVRVYRGGGAADVGNLTDPASVQLGVIADTREDSWSLMEYCRQIMGTYSNGGGVKRKDGSWTMVDSIEEMVGPSQIPELNPDKRLVPLTFRVVCRKPRGLPDYKQIRESLTA